MDAPVTLRELLEPYLFAQAVRGVGLSAEEAAARLAGLGMRAESCGVFDDDGNEIEPFDDDSVSSP